MMCKDIIDLADIIIKYEQSSKYVPINFAKLLRRTNIEIPNNFNDEVFNNDLFFKLDQLSSVTVKDVISIVIDLIESYINTSANSSNTNQSNQSQSETNKVKFQPPEFMKVKYIKNFFKKDNEDLVPSTLKTEKCTESVMIGNKTYYYDPNYFKPIRSKTHVLEFLNAN